jgi:hypothetical protein
MSDLLKSDLILLKISYKSCQVIISWSKSFWDFPDAVGYNFVGDVNSPEHIVTTNFDEGIYFSYNISFILTSFFLKSFRVFIIM